MKKPTGTTRPSQTATYNRIETIRYNDPLTMRSIIATHPGPRTPQMPPTGDRTPDKLGTVPLKSMERSLPVDSAITPLMKTDYWPL